MYIKGLFKPIYVVAAQSHVLDFDPNGPGTGLDLDFNNIDFDNFQVDFGDGLHSHIQVNNGINYSVDFNFEDVLKEAELSLGPRDTLHFRNLKLTPTWT